MDKNGILRCEEIQMLSVKGTLTVNLSSIIGLFLLFLCFYLQKTKGEGVRWKVGNQMNYMVRMCSTCIESNHKQ